MLLKSLCSMLTLNEEEAMIILRIVHYVQGKVGSCEPPVGVMVVCAPRGDAVGLVHEVHGWETRVQWLVQA